MIDDRATYAEYFHRIAGETLAKLGFDLYSGPARDPSWRADSSVCYKNGQGLYLRVSFVPIDGNYAQVDFGRRWQILGGHPERFWLSNEYYYFAAKYGLDWNPLPKLDDKTIVAEACHSIFNQIRATLPTILSRLNEMDLKKIEKQGKGGAAAIERRMKINNHNNYRVLPVDWSK